MKASEGREEITFPLYPYLLQGQQALPNCKPMSVGRSGDKSYRTPSPHPTTPLYVSGVFMTGERNTFWKCVQRERMSPLEKLLRKLITPNADGDGRTDRVNTICLFHHSSNGGVGWGGHKKFSIDRFTRQVMCFVLQVCCSFFPTSYNNFQ